MPSLLDSDGSTFKDNCVKINKVDPYCQRRECRPITLYSFRKYNVYVDIRGGFSWRGHQTIVVLSTQAIAA